MPRPRPIVLALALGAGAFALVATACSAPSSRYDAPPPSEEADPDAPRDALVIGVLKDIGNLNPVVFESATDAAMMANVLMPPIEVDFDCELVAKPGHVSSWTWSEDGKTLTYHLRDDAVWEDGEPIDADDYVFTYELLRDPDVASPRRSYTQHMTTDSPRKVDAHTIVFEFTRAYDQTTALSHANHPIVAEHVLRDADRKTMRGHPSGMQPLSSGPWRLKLHEKNTRFVLEANPHYVDATAPKLLRTIFRVIPEYQTRLIELRNGGIDMMESLQIEDVDALRHDNPEIRIDSRGFRFNDYITWNTSKPLFADPEVRRALTMSMDINEMMAKLLSGEDGTIYAKRMVSTITPELCRVHNDSIDLLPYDPDAARKIFASKGWTDSDGDGILDKDGERFSFTLATNAGNKRRAEATILVQAYLKDIGVEAHLQALETNAFYQGLRERDYDAAMAGWSAQLFVDPSGIWASDPPDGKNAFNFSAYANPEVDALIDKGLSTPDPLEALPVWRAIQERIYADQPYTFLWWQEELVGIHERFEDTTIDPLSPYRNLHEWRVPADKVKYPR